MGQWKQEEERREEVGEVRDNKKLTGYMLVSLQALKI